MAMAKRLTYRQVAWALGLEAGMNGVEQTLKWDRFNGQSRH